MILLAKKLNERVWLETRPVVCNKNKILLIDSEPELNRNLVQKKNEKQVWRHCHATLL